MSNPPVQTDEHRREADREKSLVAFSSLCAALVLTLMKLTVGLMTNSLGVLSEAAHSALDLVAAGVTWWAVRISGRPADTEHTYGHGKFENLSALFETLLLLVTCVWIVYEGVSRLFFDEAVHVEPSPWAFLVIGISILVDISRSRALKRVAVKHNSQALEADALHFSTDVWSSTVVLFGLGGVVLGERWNMPWLIQADAVAALGVAGIVVWVSIQLGKKSIDDLLDSVPKGLREQVAETVDRVSGVECVYLVRLRRSGPEYFADITLGVDHAAAFETTHRIADAVETAVGEILPKADVVVHVEPIVPDEEDLLTTVRVVAARHGLGAHAVRIYEASDGRAMELHLEVAESLQLREAHALATAFEKEIETIVPGLARIVTHIEPAGESTATRHAEPVSRGEIEAAIETFAQAAEEQFTPHDIKVYRDGHELAVSFHCMLDGTITIADAHELTQRLESHLRRKMPNLGRVVIHVEPQGER